MKQKIMKQKIESVCFHCHDVKALQHAKVSCCRVLASPNRCSRCSPVPLPVPP